MRVAARWEKTKSIEKIYELFRITLSCARKIANSSKKMVARWHLIKNATEAGRVESCLCHPAYA
jgi:hypothetical protein